MNDEPQLPSAPLLERLPLLLDSGKSPAYVRKSDGDFTLLELPHASPHGATVRGRVEGCSQSLELKVNRCKKEGETFLVEGRLRNAPKELRLVLQQLAAPGSRI